jgi:hypothetical protein
MTDCCSPEPSRRQLLLRAGAGGVLLAAALLVGDDLVADAAMPTFETVGLGEERINRDRLAAIAERSAAQAKPVPASKKKTKKKAKAPVVAAPSIVTRAEWGADESLGRGGRMFLPVRKIVVHHTASPSNPKDPEEWVRMTYRFHTEGRGYSDVGYNFLIDHLGTIYEGRRARTYAKGELHDGEDGHGYMVMGAHALGVNAGTCGIVLLGDFSTTATGQPTSKAVASLTRLIAWECARHQIDPLGTDRYVSLYGASRAFPNIAGHRDVGVTGCPGGNLYKLLPTIRQTVANQVGRFPAATADLAATIRYTDGAKASPKPVTSTPVVAPWTLTGFRVLTSDGKLAVVGSAPATSSPAAEGVKDPIAIAAGPKRTFYTLDSRGGVLAFGGAKWLGSLAKMGVQATAVDIEPTPGGDGYWILAKDGGIYGFGAARHYGSPKKAGTGVTVRKIHATPTGKGYWVLATDGSVLAYGDAPALDAVRWKKGVSVVDLAATSSGKGYWLLASSGVVVGRGDAGALGGMDSVGGAWAKPAVAIAAPRQGSGYTILTSDGTVVPFGKVPYFGSTTAGAKQAVGMAAIYA